MASQAQKERALALLNPASARSAGSSASRGPTDFGRSMKKVGRRKETKRKQNEGPGGLWAAANPVLKVLSVLDIPRRGVAGAGMATLAGSMKLAGKDQLASGLWSKVDDSFRGEYTGSDFLADAGMSQSGIGRSVAGFGIDVAMDPLTYLAGAGVLKGGGEAVAKRILETGVERVTAEELARAGLRQGENAAAEAAIRAAARAEAEPIAQRVMQRGTSSLTKEESVRFLGTTGGMRAVMPGSGRLGRKFTGLTDEVTIPIIPKKFTDPVNQAGMAVRSALGESRVARVVGEKLGGENVNYLLRRIAKTSSDPHLVGQTLDTMKDLSRVRAEGAVIFREYLRHYVDDIRPELADDAEGAVRAIESGVAGSAKGGESLKNLFDTVEAKMKEVGLDFHREDYVARIRTRESFAAEAERAGTKGTRRTGTLDNTKRRLLDDRLEYAGMNAAEVRAAAEEYGLRELKLEKGYFEKHPDRIIPIYLKAMEEKYVGALLNQRLAERGVLQPGHVVNEVLDTAAIAAKRKAVKAAGKEIGKTGKAAVKAATAREAHAEKLQGLLGRVMGPIDGPLVDGAGPPPDLPALLGEASRTAAEARQAARAPFEEMGVRELRKLASAEGVKGAHRLNKESLVDALASKANKGEFSPAARAADEVGDVAEDGAAGLAREPANADLLKQHDRVMKGHARFRADPSYPTDVAQLDAVHSYIKSLRELVANSSVPEEYAHYLDEAERLLNFVKPKAVADVADRTTWGTVIRNLEDSLSRIHEESVFGKGMRLAQMDVKEISDFYPHLLDPKVRQRVLDNYYKSQGDKLSGGYHVEIRAAERINELLGVEGGAVQQILPAIDGAALDLEIQSASLQAAHAEDDLINAVHVQGPENEALRAKIVEQKKARLKYLERASKETNRELRQVLVLEARRAQAEAAYLSQKAVSREAQDAMWAALRNPNTKLQRVMSDELARGAHAMMDPFKDLAGPTEIVDALKSIEKVATPEGMRGFLAHYDKALNYIKAWQIASPGFHVRNFMGGAFNNYLAGIDMGAYSRYSKARMGLGDPEAQRAYAYWRKVGSEGQYGTHEVTTGLSHERWYTRLNPLSSKNAYVHANQQFGGKVEDMLRGSLFMDVYLKTGSEDEALAAVFKYHFDYDDLSRFERDLVKRIIPFYTWTRKNFPLQVQSFLERPGKYTWYNHFQENFSSETEGNSIVPSYFNDLFAIPTGANFGGGQAFLTPDLPFTRTMNEPIPFENGKFSLNPIGSMMTPLIKTPLERVMGHQFFKDVPMSNKRDALPKPWAAIPGLEAGLRTVGVVDSKGTIKGMDGYVIEQYMPLLARLRRLAPSEEKYQKRAVTSWLSFVGVPLRTNTKYEQKMEKYRRYLEKTEPAPFRIPKKNK